MQLPILYASVYPLSIMHNFLLHLFIYLLFAKEKNKQTKKLVLYVVFAPNLEIFQIYDGDGDSLPDSFASLMS